VPAAISPPERHSSADFNTSVTSAGKAGKGHRGFIFTVEHFHLRRYCGGLAANSPQWPAITKRGAATCG